MQLKQPGTRKKLLAILIAGLAVRLAFVWMPGTEDMQYFRAWGALALRAGVLNVYTWKDDVTLDALFMKLHGVEVRPRTTQPTDIGPALGVPDYPPGNILFLELSAGLCRFLQGGVLRAGHLLNACLNFFPLLFGLAGTIAVWRLGGQSPSTLAAVAALWLNPALILTSPVLGYQDPIFAFFGLMALICFYRGSHTASALFLAASCLIKPQGVFIVPVLAAAFWAEGGWRLLGRSAARFALFLMVPLLPYILTGRLLTPLAAMFRGAIFPALSAQTANIWWLAGAVVQRVSTGAIGTVEMVPQSEFRALVGFDPIWLSLPALTVFTLANLYFLIVQLRAGNRRAIFWAAALEVYGYTMLALFVHENHLYAFFICAAPLLVFGHRCAGRLFAALSLLFGLNLYLFDGLGEGISGFSQALRTAPGFDLSLLIALANLAVFILLLRKDSWGFSTLAVGAGSSEGVSRNTPSQPRA